MKKKLIFGLTGMAISFGVLAGGGGSAWQPSVGPEQCLKGTLSPKAQLSWNNTPECNDVIRNGYATGAYVSGLFVYEGGQETIRFNGAASPYRTEKLDYPESVDGKKFRALADIRYQWIK